MRWDAVWIMPKHVFEKVEDPLKFDFNKPVSLGAYVLNSYDPDGKWYIWQLRDDWQRTTLGRFGKPGPKYLAYVDPGPPDKRVIAQLNHELDVIHDIAPEGMFTLAKQGKATRAWFKGFPYGHPDPTLPALIFNTQNELFKNRDVRWALALLIDIKAVSMAAYRGAATISAIGVPPTGTHPGDLSRADGGVAQATFEIDTGKRKIKPYDPTVGKQIADMLRPSMGEQIPSDPKEIAKAFGMGWWKTDPQAAQELLEKAGYTKRGGDWHHAGRQAVHRPRHGRGRPAPGDDPRRLDDRAAMEAGRHRRQDRRRAGHAADAARRRRFRHLHRLERRDLGRPPGPVLLPRQLAFAVRRRARQAAAAAQLAALVAARSSTRSSSRSATIDFDDPKAIELGRDYVKLVAREMPTIPLMAYNVFTAMDQTYWTGFRRPRIPTPIRSQLGQLPLHVREAQAGRQLSPDADVGGPGDRRAADSAARSDLASAPMTGYAAYLAKRLGQFVLVVFIGINLAYVITHATPIDPVEQSIAVVTSFGNTAPEAIEQMRQSLQRALRPGGSPLRAVPDVLEPHPARRFRALALGLSRRRSRP